MQRLKRKTPAGGRGLHSNGKVAASAFRKSHRKNTSRIIRFPKPAFSGFPRNCIRCGHDYRLPWVASTIRDGRQALCPPCYLDDIRGAA